MGVTPGVIFNIPKNNMNDNNHQLSDLPFSVIENEDLLMDIQSKMQNMTDVSNKNSQIPDEKMTAGGDVEINELPEQLHNKNLYDGSMDNDENIVSTSSSTDGSYFGKNNTTAGNVLCFGDGGQDSSGDMLNNAGEGEINSKNSSEVICNEHFVERETAFM